MQYIGNRALETCKTNTLQWWNNARGCVSNHRRIECLLKRLFRRRSKKTSKLRVTLWGEFTGDRWIPCTKGQWRGKCFHLMASSRKKELQLNAFSHPEFELRVHWQFVKWDTALRIYAAQPHSNSALRACDNSTCVSLGVGCWLILRAITIVHWAFLMTIDRARGRVTTIWDNCVSLFNWWGFIIKHDCEIKALIDASLGQYGSLAGDNFCTIQLISPWTKWSPFGR